MSLSRGGDVVALVLEAKPQRSREVYRVCVSQRMVVTTVNGAVEACRFLFH